LVQRCRWRGIRVVVKKFTLTSFSDSTISSCDLIFSGGGPDLAQKQVARDLQGHRGALRDFVESDGVGLFICGAYQLLGHYYRPAEGPDLKGIGIFDLHTRHFGETKPRCIGNVTVELIALSGELSDNTLVGFENHGGRTYLGEGAEPLGYVKKGCGNNGEDKTEGAIYKNFLGTYLHGPLLPKNPQLADFLIRRALERRYGEVRLESFDDSLENQAHQRCLRL